ASAGRRARSPARCSSAGRAPPARSPRGPAPPNAPGGAPAGVRRSARENARVTARSPPASAATRTVPTATTGTPGGAGPFPHAQPSHPTHDAEFSRSLYRTTVRRLTGAVSRIERAGHRGLTGAWPGAADRSRWPPAAAPLRMAYLVGMPSVISGLVLLAFWLFCLFHVIATPWHEVRNLPKAAWVIIVALLPGLGGLLW